LSDVVGGSGKAASKPVVYLQYTFKTVYVTSVT